VNERIREKAGELYTGLFKVLSEKNLKTRSLVNNTVKTDFSLMDFKYLPPGKADRILRYTGI
jgi:hypothetical protein